ncbi:phage tail protein [Rheinheimera maricola]|uniref:Phage tail protein n=1 Tax=Rheinheimera maricola TaxID=2793282 RepID=A0ABS7X4H6_9GAMM|nr:phage tail protein [Rheinheimera maricola]MBZ9610079.1 phage tail protein [Rheinheimera maricola]
MADDTSTQATAVWPIAKFYFQVQWDSQVMCFQEVSGLDVETQDIDYRAGAPSNDSSPTFSAIKMPGLKKQSNVTMKKGLFKLDNRFWDWFNQIKLNTTKRLPITISLLDEAGGTTMVWTLSHAWPTKITATNLDSDGNEVAIESIEIAHEGISMDTP